LWIYQESLSAPWINASWSATVTFNSTQKPFAGTRSIKVVESGWGALSLHDGDWAATQSLDPSRYQSLEFQVFCASAGFNLAVRLENDAKASFPEIVFGTIPKSKWTKVSVPISQLDPNAQLFDRLDVRDYGGKNRTYFVDNVRFVGKTP
jgi:hypothetical protein